MCAFVRGEGRIDSTTVSSAGGRRRKGTVSGSVPRGTCWRNVRSEGGGNETI